MNPIFLSAAILPLLATMFIPDAIRERKTGKFLGFLNRNVVLYFLGISIVEFILMIDKFGIELGTGLRAVGIAQLTITGGIAFTLYSHKHNYGEPLNTEDKVGKQESRTSR